MHTEVARVQPGLCELGFDGLDRGRDPGDVLGEPLFGGKACELRLDHEPCLEDGVGHDDDVPHRSLGRRADDDGASAAVRAQDAGELERRQCLADGGAANAEPWGQLALRREHVAGGEPPGTDRFDDLVGDLGGRAAGGDLRERVVVVWARCHPMQAAPTGRDEVDAYVRSLVGYMAEHPTHLRLVIEVVVAKPNTEVLLAADQPRWGPLAAAIKRGRREGALVDVDARTAAVVLGGGIDAVFTEAMNDPSYELDAATECLLELFNRSTDQRSHA